MQLRPGRLRGPQGGAEAVEACEVVGERDQIPFETHFGEAPQREAPEAEHLFDDAEDRLDGLLAQFVERATGGGGRAVTHPFGQRGVGARRGRVGALLELRDGVAVGFALQGDQIRQECFFIVGRLADAGADRP